MAFIANALARGRQQNFQSLAGDLNRSWFRGFTLPEVLAALAVVTILVGIGIGSFAPVSARAGRTRAAAELRVIRQALEAFRGDFGDYPLTGACPPTPVSSPPVAGTAEVKVFNALTGRLDAMLRPLRARGRTYLDPSELTVATRNESPEAAGEDDVLNAFLDPWGNPYRYAYRSAESHAWRAASCLLYSLGPDGREVASIGGEWESDAVENRDNIHG